MKVLFAVKTEFWKCLKVQLERSLTRWLFKGSKIQGKLYKKMPLFLKIYNIHDTFFSFMNELLYHVPSSVSVMGSWTVIRIYTTCPFMNWSGDVLLLKGSLKVCVCSHTCDYTWTYMDVFFAFFSLPLHRSLPPHHPPPNQSIVCAQICHRHCGDMKVCAKERSQPSR